ncbi:hypothetical protein NARC_150019 [Candidatus Nitrosocosmicus arcticus]|uniref:Uncharacterized protein n=1 Tax=Candidatus Nitrosocosmicus arcticus TaxID=2035267 RepID=A0A557SS57_9ARCH|nr:hypothetical protein NARC_150019 [Candidatus Nitrosocosmicus arcticus]
MSSCNACERFTSAESSILSDIPAESCCGDGDGDGDGKEVAIIVDISGDPINKPNIPRAQNIMIENFNSCIFI